jgi:hypothetical protein
MTMSSVVFIEFDFIPAERKCVSIETNIRPEYIDEVLESWVSSQLNTGKDTNKPNEKDTYHIKIVCDLETDTFTTISNAGNMGLTAGIVEFVWTHHLWRN